MEVRQIGGREVTLRRGTDKCLITFYADFDQDSLSELFDSVPNCTILAMRINDWNQELSPWEAPPVFGQEGFGHDAKDTLQYITDILSPEFGFEDIAIGGYSLAGLFSLWACYNTDIFSGCAAASPSVWFPDWDDFIQSNTIRTKNVYLSLGEKESKTKNQLMRAVSERIELQYDLLKDQLDESVILEWNPGNHFQDFIKRKSRAFNWIMNRI